MENHDAILPKGGLTGLTAVAIDRDKNSQHAVRWAVDNFKSKENIIILLHVKNSQQNLHPQDCERQMQQLFIPYRGLCGRKGVGTKEVVLHGVDVAVALSDYIGANSINNVVLGASTRSAITRAFKNADVPTCLCKLAPHSCSLYTVSKGKSHKIKSSIALPPQRHGSPVNSPSEASVGSSAPATPFSTTSNDCSSSHHFAWENTHTAHPSFQNTYSFSDHHSYFSHVSYVHLDDASTELEDELKRVKQELKQITDKYNAACLQSTTAMEKGRGIARDKHNSNAQLLPELESEKRIQAERNFMIESKEKEIRLGALAHSLARCRRYHMEDIQAATNNFNSNKIGEGSYGPVYKATIDHTPVAIKILKSDISEGLKQFQQEVEVLSQMRHPNMVLLLGACPEYGCLVYEYMDNGCLEDRLFCKNDTPPLPWTTRFKIAAEIATGLNFLHQKRPQSLVHRDLKPANILLDKNFVSKIGDVGLSRLVPLSVSDKETEYRITAAAGTFCYIDPEYQQTGLLGTKSDVYSLGIILLQIITAKPAMGLRHQVQIAIEEGRFKEILDRRIKDWPVEEALSIAKLALKCSELMRRDRPNLDFVLPELERLRDVGSLLKPGKKSYCFTYSEEQGSRQNLSSYHVFR